MDTAAVGGVMLGIFGLSGAEPVLVLVLILLRFGANRIPRSTSDWARGIKRFRREVGKSGREVGESLGAGLGKPVADALTHANQTREIQDPPALDRKSVV